MTRPGIWRMAILAGATLALPLLTYAQESDSRFSIVVVPDTQYLFDQDRGNAEVLRTGFQWIIDHQAEHNIVFVAPLGDMVENALPEEFQQLDGVYDLLDEAGIPYSVFAGNHDLTNSGQYDDQRAEDEPYLQYFAPERVADQPTFGGATENGYNSYYIFEGAGQEWLLLALDWQASRESVEWAQGVIDAHPTLPVIITTHQLVDDNGEGTGEAYITDYGQYLYDALVAPNDQVLLTLNGHYWPSARLTAQNDAGNAVHLHLANYQDQYYGGEGMIRLYEFDLARDMVEVSTFSPWVLSIPETERNPLMTAEHLNPRDHFVEQIDFEQRFAGFAGANVAEAASVPVADLLVEGTVAYWRFDGADGQAVADDVVIADASSMGNDLTRVTLDNGDADSLVYTAEHHSAQPGSGSLFFNGSSRNPNFNGAYLQTVDDAPLNAMTFENGYTVEFFIRLPADCCGSDHAWMGVLSRLETGADVGQTEGDLDEPAAQFGISPGRQLQWAIRPTNGQDLLTNWSHEVEADVWRHVAVVNDGSRTVMYVDGAEILRNPRAESIGLASNGAPWLIGAGHYANTVEQSFYGWLGDVRIVERALTPDEFLIAR